MQSGQVLPLPLTRLDNVGNVSANSLRRARATVDTSAPGAPGLTLSENPADADQHVVGTTLFYRPGQAGSFKVAATASDGQSGDQARRLPVRRRASRAGRTTPPPPTRRPTRWNGVDERRAFGLATVTNNTDLTGAGATLRAQADSTAPSTTDNSASLGPAWRNTDANVVLSPGDGAGAGVEATHYTTDGSVPTTSSSQGTSFTLSRTASTRCATSRSTTSATTRLPRPAPP